MSNFAEETYLEVVACNAEAATALITRPDGMRSVLKAARRSEEKLEALRVQWNVLSLLGDETGFPGPRPLERYRSSNGIEAIELTYLPGTHPRFGDQQEFHAFGATIAHLHRASRGKRLADAQVWDLARVARHFENPQLLRLMGDVERRIVRSAVEQFGPIYQKYFTDNYWTGLIHSDSHRHNIVLHEGQGSLIDFGESGVGVLFWDLGVAVADSAIDAPEHAATSRRALGDGYLSVLPDAGAAIERHLPVFEALRALEIMTWPVSDWAPERLTSEEGAEKAHKNIAVSLEHLRSLM